MTLLDFAFGGAIEATHLADSILGLDEVGGASTADSDSTKAHEIVGFRRGPPDEMVEVKGFEPSASTLRMSGSRPFDQGLSEDFPGGSVSIPSGSLTIPLLPSR